MSIYKDSNDSLKRVVNVSENISQCTPKLISGLRRLLKLVIGIPVMDTFPKIFPKGYLVIFVKVSLERCQYARISSTIHSLRESRDFRGTKFRFEFRKQEAVPNEVAQVSDFRFHVSKSFVQLVM